MAKMASLEQELASMIAPVRVIGSGTPEGTCYSTGARVALEREVYSRVYQFDEADDFNYGLSDGQMIVRDDHHGYVVVQTIDFEDVK